MTSQLDFGFIADLDRATEEAEFDRLYGHLPETMPEGIAYYRDLIDRHHERMMAGDVDGTMALRNEAHNLAARLNGGEFGILASDDAPGKVLERETAASPGVIPKWGQTGTFEITVGQMQVRIEQKGMFGIGAHHLYWSGFYAHAVDHNRPFLSETGFRSFLTCGPSGLIVGGISPEACARAVIEQHVSRDLKGKLRKITPLCELERPRQTANDSVANPS